MPLRHPALTRVHSIMETPVLDPRKWAKVPHQPTDAVLVDMEDTVPQSRKVEGRAAVVAALGEPHHFGDRLLLCRPNGLETKWWQEDVAALAGCGATHVLLPMITAAGDVRRFQQEFRRHGSDPYLVPGIETPGGVAHVEEIAEVDNVVALVFGEGDLTAMSGLPIHAADGSINPMVTHARSRVYVAAAANGLGMFDIPFIQDIRDLSAFRERAEEFRIMGATALFAMYPPHVGVINDVFRPDQEAVEHARHIVAAFEEATAAGHPAVQLEDGRTLLIHDYKKAVGLLERAGRHD